MKKDWTFPPSLIFSVIFILTYSNAQNTPPVLVAVPRTLQLALDTKVGTVVCRVKATDHDGDEVEFSIDPSPAAGFPGRLPFKDGSPYFRIAKRGSEGFVTLAVSLLEEFKVGDQLTLSVTGVDGASGITTRTEIPVFIEEPIDDDPVPATVATTTIIQTPTQPQTPTSPTTNGTSTTATTPTKTTTTTKSDTTTTKGTVSVSPSSTQEPVSGVELEEEKTEEELSAERSKKYILTLVPIFVVCPALGVAVYILRHKLVVLIKKCCGSGSTSNDEKDVSKIENADGEFFKMQADQRKISTNSYGFSPKAGGEVNAIPILRDEDRWEFPRHQLKILSMLGEGSFGQVWKCEAENIDGNKGTTVVAMKTLKESSGDKKDLLHELAVMKMLEPHPNVVKLLGCCTDKDPIFVIIEFISGGTLQEFLRKSRSEHNYKNLHGESQTLSARDLTSYAYQIAKGMAYLSSKKVIHRDLAARNVLVTFDDPSNKNSCVCKVCDFGFARDVMANNIYERKSEGKLPIRWMAPESLYDNCYTTKSDVWSFGVLLWEIVTLGSTPYPGLSSSEVLKRVRDGYRLEKPEHCKREIYNIMYYCWNKNPDERPSFSALVQDFETLLVKETDYIDLNMFPEHAYYNELSLSGEKV